VRNGRELQRRLERLEDQIAPSAEPQVLEVRFISPATREVVKTLSFSIAATPRGNVRGKTKNVRGSSARWK
jgi:hypothetical protein